jgi:hypothetical protein
VAGVAVPVGRFGRTPAPPPGKLYVRDPQVGWALSVVAAVQKFKDAGVPVPEHLVSLVEQLPDDLPDTSTILIDSDFVPLEPYGSAEPMGGPPPAAEPDDQPSLWDQEQTETVDLEGWTVAELKDALDQVGVEYPANARKQELIELLEEAEQ